MSGAPIISGITKFPRPANTGMMNRKISSEAWTENSPLNVLRVDEVRAGLGQLRAHQHRDQPADQQEDERVDRVLDPDHLVVGVDPEVVLPRVGAVAGVVLGARRAPGGPVEPVVEAADADQEGERDGDQRDREDRVGVEEVLEGGVPGATCARATSGSAENSTATSISRPAR